MKVSRWTLLWLLIVGVLIVIWVAVDTGVITAGDVIGSLFTFVVALVVIAIMALIGAVFLGMVISHRIMAGQAFTPFEEEMLKMRQEVHELKDRLDAIAGRLGTGPNGRDKGR